jgi:cold shock CspA family protein
MSAESTTWRNGVVHWFDELTGDGLIKDQDGKSYYVHYSAIQSSSDWRTLEDKQKVSFKLVKTARSSQVSHVKVKK